MLPLQRFEPDLRGGGYGSPMDALVRLTLDMTAIRDVVYEERERHRDGLRLLSLAERGDVELGIPPRGP